jgi:hypothetical protein
MLSGVNLSSRSVHKSPYTSKQREAAIKEFKESQAQDEKKDETKDKK